MTALIVFGLVVVGCSLLASCVRAIRITTIERRDQWDRERADLERQRRGLE